MGETWTVRSLLAWSREWLEKKGVDNPRLDHDYTVFAQVLNGIEVIDRLLEGDVIDTIEIIP